MKARGRCGVLWFRMPLLVFALAAAGCLAVPPKPQLQLVRNGVVYDCESRVMTGTHIPIMVCRRLTFEELRRQEDQENMRRLQMKGQIRKR